MDLGSEAFSESQAKAFQLVMERACQDATDALSQLLGRHISMRAVTSKVVRLNEVPYLLGGPQTPAVGVYLKVEGDAAGQFVLILPEGAGMCMVDLMMGLDEGTTSELDEMGISALCEAGNITGSFMLSRLSDAAGMSLRPGPPAFANDMVAAILSEVLAQIYAEQDDALVVEADFAEDVRTVRGFILLVLDSESFVRVLRRMGAGR